MINIKYQTWNQSVFQLIWWDWLGCSWPKREMGWLELLWTVGLWWAERREGRITRCGGYFSYSSCAEKVTHGTAGAHILAGVRKMQEIITLWLFRDWDLLWAEREKYKYYIWWVKTVTSWRETIGYLHTKQSSPSISVLLFSLSLSLSKLIN